ncbi:MAG: DUF6152 family protein [Acidobacteriota bacterium]
MAVVTAATALAIPVAAHHSFAAEYDGNAAIKITGTLTKVDWVNPHSWIQVDVKDAAGKVTTWRCETAPPNGLIRRGVTKSTFPIGQEVTVEGYRAKDGFESHERQQRDHRPASASLPAPPATVRRFGKATPSK